ncbi:hypothetical protein KL86PLE_40586 [uncultured Pleomorphomonas sp.]|uniref:Uncharacterized protein n=1 Tax=uncultured Pleomorphomonas sp. TaxID=442121 RepID=A0A212LGT8_9HYPH|nr:hypothetical protein KL86PLE_40586 [uncultured Pleomorphomonas sp.]
MRNSVPGNLLQIRRRRSSLLLSRRILRKPEATFRSDALEASFAGRLWPADAARCSQAADAGIKVTFL